MARVLLVEDEDRYRDIVARYLSLAGHDVLDTASGEEAVALGLAHRPDVLVADWMLRHSVHGLHVAEALRAADPALHTVLVTGFPDSDLTMDRTRVGIVDLLEKPFDMEDLGNAVARAVEAPEGKEEEGVAVFVLDGQGAIKAANRAGGRLRAAAGQDDAGLDAVLSMDSHVRLGQADGRWVLLETAVRQPLWARTRELPDGGRLLVLCPSAQEWRRDDPRVRVLLGLPLGRAKKGGFREPLLLIDDSETVCDSFVAQLASRGCAAHAASDHAQGIATLRAEPEIRVVVLDYAMPGEDLRATVAQLREVRPGVRLIGTSGEDRSPEFSELGIEEFLQKPWTVSGDLLSLLGSGVQPIPESIRRES